MAFFGFLIALVLFFHYKRRLRYYHRRQHAEETARMESTGAVSWPGPWC